MTDFVCIVFVGSIPFFCAPFFHARFFMVCFYFILGSFIPFVREMNES